MKEVIFNNEFKSNDFLTFESTVSSASPSSSSSKFLDTASITSQSTTNMNIRSKQEFLPEEKGVFFFNIYIQTHVQSNNFAIGIADNSFKFDYNMVGFQTDDGVASFGYSSDGYYRSGEYRSANTEFSQQHEKWGELSSTVGCLVDFSTNEIMFFSDGILLNDRTYPLFVTKAEKKLQGVQALEASPPVAGQPNKKKKKQKVKKIKVPQQTNGQSNSDNTPDFSFGGLFEDSVPSPKPVQPLLDDAEDGFEKKEEASSSASPELKTEEEVEKKEVASSSASITGEKTEEDKKEEEKKEEELKEEKKEEEKTEEKKEEASSSTITAEEKTEDEGRRGEESDSDSESDDEDSLDIDDSCINDYKKPFFFVFTFCGTGEKIKLSFNLSCSFFHIFPRLLKRKDFKKGLDELLNPPVSVEVDKGKGKEKAENEEI